MQNEIGFFLYMIELTPLEMLKTTFELESVAAYQIVLTSESEPFPVGFCQPVLWTMALVRGHRLYSGCYIDGITPMEFTAASLVILLNTCPWLWLDSVQELFFWSVFLFSKEIKYSEVNQGPCVVFYMSQGHVSWADDRVANGDKVVRGCTNPWHEGCGGAANKAEPMLSGWANAFEKIL